MDTNSANTHFVDIVNKLNDIVSAIEVDPDRVIMFDEIAFMFSKWEGVKNRPIGSAISMSTLSGHIVKSPIILGGDDFYEKAQKREPVLFTQQPIPASFGMKTY